MVCGIEKYGPGILDPGYPVSFSGPVIRDTGSVNPHSAVHLLLQNTEKLLETRVIMGLTLPIEPAPG